MAKKPQDAGGYSPPPNDSDLAQSAVHHNDSGLFNLRHAKTHNDSTLRALKGGDTRSAMYNASHAAGHIQDALGHVEAQQDRMTQNPRFAPHARALGGDMTMGGRSAGGDAGGEEGIPEVSGSLNPPRVTVLHIMPMSRPAGDRTQGMDRSPGGQVMGDDGKGSLPRPFGRKTPPRGARRR